MGKFTTVFKDKNSFKSHKTVEIKVFLIFLLAGGKGIRLRTNNHGS
jgi:hypothetical protein